MELFCQLWPTHRYPDRQIAQQVVEFQLKCNSTVGRGKVRGQVRPKVCSMKTKLWPHINGHGRWIQGAREASGAEMRARIWAQCRVQSTKSFCAPLCGTCTHKCRSLWGAGGFLAPVGGTHFVLKFGFRFGSESTTLIALIAILNRLHFIVVGATGEARATPTVFAAAPLKCGN